MIATNPLHRGKLARLPAQDQIGLLTSVMECHNAAVRRAQGASTQVDAGTASAFCEAVLIHGDLSAASGLPVEMRLSRSPEASNDWLSQVDIIVDGQRRISCELLTGFDSPCATRSSTGPATVRNERPVFDGRRAQYLRDLAAADAHVPRPSSVVRRSLNLSDACSKSRTLEVFEAFTRNAANLADFQSLGLRPELQRVHLSQATCSDDQVDVRSWLHGTSSNQIYAKASSVAVSVIRKRIIASCEIDYTL